MASMKIKNANDVNERIARPEAPEMNLHHLTRIFLLASRHASLLSEVIRLSDIHMRCHMHTTMLKSDKRYNFSRNWLSNLMARKKENFTV